MTTQLRRSVGSKASFGQLRKYPKPNALTTEVTAARPVPHPIATTNAPSRYTTPKVSIGARLLSTPTSSVSAEIAAAATSSPSHIGGAVGRTSVDSTRLPVCCHRF